MSVLRRVVTNDGSHYGIRFHCPGCCEEHVITTKPYPGGWDFDGNFESPTIAPSILVHETKRPDGTVISPCCHSFVRGGQIEFLKDSTHALAGRTVPLPQLPEHDA